MRAEDRIPSNQSVDPAVTGKEYFPALDGLRGVAVLIVMLAHGSVRLFPGDLTYRGGWLGVEVFFVLSGFLITSLLLKEKLMSGRVSLTSFWTRRALRIWPLYYAVLLLYVFVLPQLDSSMFARVYVAEGEPGWGAYRDSLWSFFVFLQNYVTGPSEVRLGLGIFWSLAIEEHFYLFWPLLVTFLKPRFIGPAAVAVLVASFGCRTLALYGVLPSVDGLGHMTHENLDAIALGSLVACVYALRRAWIVAAARHSYALLVPAVIVLVLLFADGWKGSPVSLSPPLFGLYRPTLVALAVGALIVAAVGRQVRFAEAAAKAGGSRRRAERKRAPRPLGRFMESRPMVHIGRVSFGLYLLHPIILGATTALARNTTGPWGQIDSVPALLGARILWTTVFLGGTLGLASLSYRYYEGPMLRLKKRFEKVK